MKKHFTFLVVILFLLTGSLFASSDDSLINKEDAPVQFFAEYEKGFISVLSHTIKIGSSGTTFDYVIHGGQDILFPFERINVGAVINDRHRISFLYQPLEINTLVPFEEEVIVDDKDFGGSSSAFPMELKYSFPFWRVSYSYDLMERKDVTIGVGVALQIRNASIIFKAVDGSQISVSQNTGLVPALHFYTMWETPVGINLSSDITGSYASSAIINGADFEFEGSILDASLRAGYRLMHNVEMFGNIRFFGGTSKGTSTDSGSNWSVSSSDDRFSQNNIATLTSTIGLTIR
jgi:hypothetical protein